MKKACIVTLIFVLTATIFTGCRNMGSTTQSTEKPGTSSSSRPTVVPMPEIPLPSGTNTTSPSNGTGTPGGISTPGASGAPNGTEMPGRAARPSARGPRY